MARLDHVRDPLLTAWQARLPQLRSGWWVLLALIIAVTAGACALDNRRRHEARGVGNRVT